MKDMMKETKTNINDAVQDANEVKRKPEKKRHGKGKTAAVIAVLLVISIVCLSLLQRLVMPKYNKGIVEGAFLAEYYEETTNHDVIFIGDCEVYENFSPIKMYEDYGITSYIRGGPQQLIWHSYYQLEDTLRYEKPKVVVFNVLSLKYNEAQSESYNRMNIDGMKWSETKYNLIQASMMEDESMVEYLFPLLRYHSRITELKSSDFEYMFKTPQVSHNGYYMRVDVKPAGTFPDPPMLPDYEFGDKAMEYLDKMTELCKENDIELILVKAPVLYPYWYPEWDANVQAYAEAHDLVYINFIELADEIGIDFQTDTYDAGLHLNLSGAEKLSSYFGQYLAEQYGLEDHRNDPVYQEAYEGKIEFYNAMMQQQYDELEKYGKIISFGAEAIED